MRLWDCWQSDVEGADVVRRECACALNAAIVHALIEGLPSGASITVRELSGDRERVTFRVGDLFGEASEP